MHNHPDFQNSTNNDPINHWAHLEGKSESMAADLTQQAEDDDTKLSIAARLLGMCVAIVIIVLLLLIAVFSCFSLEAPSETETAPSVERVYL